jgi:hypothetical protein
MRIETVLLRSIFCTLSIIPMFSNQNVSMDKVQKIDRSNTTLSSKTFRGESHRDSLQENTQTTEYYYIRLHFHLSEARLYFRRQMAGYVRIQNVIVNIGFVCPWRLTGCTQTVCLVVLRGTLPGPPPPPLDCFFQEDKQK